MEKKQYLYLMISGDRFKIGYSRDPYRRLKEYKTHNTTCEIRGIFAVDSKKMEQLVHMELLKKQFRRCQQPEWFYGNITLKEVEAAINDITIRIQKNKVRLDI